MEPVPVLWMFDDSQAEEVASDVNLILEQRTSLNEKGKGLSKLITYCEGGDDSLRALAGNMKNQLTQIQVWHRRPRSVSV